MDGLALVLGMWGQENIDYLDVAVGGRGILILIKMCNSCILSE